MKRMIIKVGTSTLTQGTEKLSRRYMLRLVQEIVVLQQRGSEVVLVSSGAVATGRDVFNGPHSTLATKQMFASIGQVKLMQIWSELFALFDLQIGQILLTKEDFSDRKRELTRQTLNALLENKIVPIINENDPVASKELSIGDNDNLAALVAEVIDADTLILLTDQEGLFTANPEKDPQAQLIPIVEKIDAAILHAAGNTASSTGTGGMVTKVEAAQVAARCGIRTIIASSRENALIDLADGKQIGTLFLEREKAHE
jgi:glutamate 5-kinase